MCPGRGGTTAGRAEDLAREGRQSAGQLRAAPQPSLAFACPGTRLHDEAIVTDALDVEQTSVGCKANLAQFGKIFEASADTKVTRIVMIVSVRSASSSLW